MPIYISYYLKDFNLPYKKNRITELHRQRDKKVKGRIGEADRRVPKQPNVFIGTDGKVARYINI